MRVILTEQAKNLVVNLSLLQRFIALPVQPLPLAPVVIGLIAVLPVNQMVDLTIGFDVALRHTYKDATGQCK